MDAKLDTLRTTTDTKAADVLIHDVLTTTRGDATLRAYGDHVIPAVGEHVTAKS